jgi:hypothetical protein
VVGIVNMHVNVRIGELADFNRVRQQAEHL